MQYATFNATCPFELGDKVKMTYGSNFNPPKSRGNYTIVDILAIHSLRNKSVTFKAILQNTKGVNQEARDMERIQLIENI
jgi:hypothetical protein